MSNPKELTQYYEAYHEKHDNKGYHMEMVKDTSRVKFIKQYLTQLLKPGDKVLDVGCGDLYLSKLMPEFEWHGIDIAPYKSADNITVQDLMVVPYPYQDQQFDAVVCSEVLEHLWDLRVVHQEVHRILKDGGIYLVSTPNFDHIDLKLSGYREVVFDSSWTHLFEHIRFYTPECHRKYLAESGFAVRDEVGADAHYSKYFAKARAVLLTFLKHNCNLNVDIGGVDQLLGMMFPDTSHTIMLVSEKLCQQTLNGNLLEQKTTSESTSD